VWHRAYDGGAGEVAQVAGAMRVLPKLAGKRRLLLVGDSKLVSYANLGDIMAAEVDFIAPASKPGSTDPRMGSLFPDAGGVSWRAGGGGGDGRPPDVAGEGGLLVVARPGDPSPP
jgi:hypothetical protein